MYSITIAMRLLNPTLSRNLHAKEDLSAVSRKDPFQTHCSLFLICIRDAECLLFAEDTSIFYQNRNPKIPMNNLDDEICHVATWLKANKMSINVNKNEDHDF